MSSTHFLPNNITYYVWLTLSQSSFPILKCYSIFHNYILSIFYFVTCCCLQISVFFLTSLFPIYIIISASILNVKSQTVFSFSFSFSHLSCQALFHIVCVFWCTPFNLDFFFSNFTIPANFVIPDRKGSCNLRTYQE